RPSLPERPSPTRSLDNLIGEQSVLPIAVETAVRPLANRHIRASPDYMMAREVRPRAQNRLAPCSLGSPRRAILRTLLLRYQVRTATPRDNLTDYSGAAGAAQVSCSHPAVSGPAAAR